MKVIKYQLVTEIVHEAVVPVVGGDGEPIIRQETKQEVEQVFSNMKIRCPDEHFEEAYTAALSQAYNGEVTVEEVADPEIPTPSGGDLAIWDEMASAITEGVNDV